MKRMILVYVTCKGKKEADAIGRQLMKKRLAPCFNIISGVSSASFWPPQTGDVENARETVLLIKTLEDRFDAVEQEVRVLHSDDVPCIFAIPIDRVSDGYHRWLVKEMEVSP